MNTVKHELRIDGVYRAGFAKTQEPYNDAVTKLFASLDRLEKVLDGKDYLVGNTLTEADVRLFTTIVRIIMSYRQVEEILKSFGDRFVSTPSTTVRSNATSAQSEADTQRFICKFPRSVRSVRL